MFMGFHFHSSWLLIILIFWLILFIWIYPVSAADSAVGKEVIINQNGYLPEMPKWVVATRKADKFTLVNEQTLGKVYFGKLSPVFDPTSKRQIWRGEFTGLHTPGTYRIEVPGVGCSYPFSIATGIYNKVFELGTRFFYLQRCGINLNDQESGLCHPACHCKDGYIARQDLFNQQDDLFSSVGGWHDAGDYGKYVTTTTITVAHMLLAFELWPRKFSDGQLRIPESGNGIPDILDEARYGLEWLFTMQRSDGAVYHKIGGQFWAGFESPDQDIQKRFVYGISTADTAKFTATMAIAARALDKCDPQLAERASKAAFKAWSFLESHQFLWDHHKSDDQGSGAYSISNDSEDRLWAALELSTLKLQNKFLEKFISQFKDYQPQAIGWSSSGVIGLFDYARSAYAEPEWRKIAVHKVVSLAGQYLTVARASGYHYTLNFQEFLWASNKEGLSRGAVLLMADLLQPDPQYRQNALAQLDFILGFNPLSKCFVSGLGTNTVTDLHHRFAAAAGKSIPGALAGGPNNLAESGIEQPGQGPFSYVDFQLSYSSNEPAIDYNAALIFISAAFVD
ncbi:MAG TPA: glycosyl hydrolase family 5 [Firmicutes bacterium]|jgi:endoglucanase|nr:glycosyl hydrolase family 5 [Bacillota bacterium]